MSSSTNNYKRPGTIDYSKWDNIDIDSNSESSDDNMANNITMSNTTQLSNLSISDGLEALNNLSMSKEAIPIEELQEKIEQLPISLVESTTWFHHLCKNKNVTLELVEFALNYCPGLANYYSLGFCPEEESEESWAFTHPLHLACCNSECPNSVVKLLVEKAQRSKGDRDFPPALEHLSVIHEGRHVKGVPCGDYDGSDVQGLPLHYYLSREENIDINIVKLLLYSHPQSLKTCDEESELTPLHVLFYNQNIGNLYDIVEYLVDYDNLNLVSKGGYGATPLHLACDNKNITPEIVTKLLDACPPSIGMEEGCLERNPVHSLCANKDIDDSLAIKILKVLIEGLDVFKLISRSRPLLQRDCDGFLPIYHALESSKPAGFIKLMLEACPELEETELDSDTDEHHLLMHHACEKSNAGVVKYLLERNFGSCDRPNSYGLFPIHIAADRVDEHVFDIIECLLRNDPSCAAQNTSSDREFPLPLHFACYQDFLHPGVVKLLYNAYPEAVFKKKSERMPMKPIDCAIRKSTVNPSLGTPHNRSVQQFIIDQMNYLCLRKDRSKMTTPDQDDYLPLDRALSKQAPLGTIKELVEAYPEALKRKHPNRGSFPLHIACYCNTVDVVKYLVESDDSCLDECDDTLEYPLHYACNSGNNEVINYLLDRQSSSVSKRNVNEELPIHLFCKSSRVTNDNDSPGYVGTVYRLLLVQPDVVMNW